MISSPLFLKGSGGSGGSGSTSNNSGNSGKGGSSSCKNTREATYCNERKSKCQYTSVRNSCKKTCGLCKAGSSSSSVNTECRDTHKRGTDYCQEWTSACKDDNYPNFRNYCKKTCGLCCKDTHSKGSGYCRKWKKSCSDDRYKGFQNNCRKTCGRCS